MWFLFSIFLITIIVLSLLKSPIVKGMVGEYRVKKILKKAGLSFGGCDLNDIMLEDNRSSSQIDHILLTQKALYVIETKNYHGHIYGNESSQKWTMTVKHVNKQRSKKGKLYRKTHISKHQFYNPIKQNQTHIRKIVNLTNFDQDLPIVNIVVFGNKAVLKDVTHSKQNYVINEIELLKTINTIERSILKEIDIVKQIDIIDKLVFLNITLKRERRQHIKRIKTKYQIDFDISDKI
ncbi:NERD domain-containing protein [Mycoplasmatota bacterium]|nr:NERD domain-containing protein [Mycoplasmatota bacterium]